MADIFKLTSLNPHAFYQTISSAVSRGISSAISATTKLQTLAKCYFSSNANCPTWNDEMKNACSKNASLEHKLGNLVIAVEQLEMQIAALNQLPRREEEIASLVQKRNALYEQMESVRSEIRKSYETRVELLKQETDRIECRLTKSLFSRIFTRN